MSNVIDLGKERERRDPVERADVECAPENGAVVFSIDRPTSPDVWELVWTPDAAREVARKLLAAAHEAERTKP